MRIGEGEGEGEGGGLRERVLILWWIVPKGSKITFTTETFGLGFFVGQRKVCYIVLVLDTF